MLRSRLIIFKWRNKFINLSQRIKIQVCWNNNKKLLICKEIQKKLRSYFRNKKMSLMRLKMKKIRLKKNCF